MQAPIGFSGVQTVPNSLQSTGSMTPRSTLGHSQPLISLPPLARCDREARLGVELGVGVGDAQGAVGQMAETAPLEAVARAKVSAISAWALRLPSR
jgi:hypothetical protein